MHEGRSFAFQYPDVRVRGLLPHEWGKQPRESADVDFQT